MLLSVLFRHGSGPDSFGQQSQIVFGTGRTRFAAYTSLLGDGTNPLRLDPGEIVTEILVPPLARRTYSCYLKLRERGTLDFPVVGVAASVRFEEDNATCREAKIVLSGISSAPVEAWNAETYLEGKRVTQDSIKETSLLARDETAIYSINGIPANYRRAMIKEYVSRALSQVQQMAGGESRQ